MVPFQGISNHNGVFITGREPYWVFCERDSLRFHPMTIEGKIGAFTPFHNISNPHGYIYCADAQVHINPFPRGITTSRYPPLLSSHFRQNRCLPSGPILPVSRDSFLFTQPN